MEREKVRKRLIYYIPGFDPFHPRRYRELYRRESVKQAEISNYSISQNAGGMGPYGWRISSQQDGDEVISEMRVLVWSDIVQSSMSAGIVATYMQLCRTAWIYISTGALRRLAGMRPGPVIAALFPVVVLLGQLLASVLVAWATAQFLLWSCSKFGLVSDLVSLGAAALGLLLIGVQLRWWKKKDPRIYAYYLMHDYAFAARWRGANPPALEARMAEFSAQIAEALQGDADEVVVIGHSSGAHLGISILADLVRMDQIPTNGPTLSFLSLGQVVPMMSFLPEAKRLRRDLHDLSQTNALFWLDISAPADGACFALCDPVKVSGVAPQNQCLPLMLSAAYSQTLTPETQKQLEYKHFKKHFQYLCAFDAPGDYDYFRITAGPKTLANRFAHRSASKSVISDAKSKFTAMS